VAVTLPGGLFRARLAVRLHQRDETRPCMDRSRMRDCWTELKENSVAAVIEISHRDNQDKAP
jgi:hypothetical protein